ncbi:MAG: carbon-monoxide dehydrogenase large subunit [Chloroflexi bacterium]|jgi:CO/xanthine dehydrogenase Mo-binding subunit|nr:MAG: carbon-monoxide dehydrogenase large subunit [Chloroflexota bacterium]
MTTATQFRYIGKPTKRVDGVDKVTGAARYTADVLLEGMLWAKILRSPHAHARIRSIDAAKARQVPGVHAVLTAKDVPDVLVGRNVKDLPLLARDRVRFFGERVAVVVADSTDIAEEAMSLIEVDYEPMPAVFEPLEAKLAGAPVIHPDFQSYEVPPNLWKDPRPDDVSPNVYGRKNWAKGDIEKGFAEADLIVEHTYHTPVEHQGYIEPHAVVVRIGEDGRADIWAHSKQPHNLRKWTAEAVGVEASDILVNVTYIGGDFGGKSTIMDAPLAYLAAKATGHPVKLVLTYAEELMAADPRHESYIWIKAGVKKDGTIVAWQADSTFNGGAYAACKPGGFLAPAHQLGGTYNLPNTLMQTDNVYTNTVPCGPCRAPGSPQANFAVESHIDAIAEILGMDPLELRLKNVLRDGDTNATGHQWLGIRAEETLRRAAEMIGWGNPKEPDVGRSIVLFEHGTGGGNSNARVVVEADGTVRVESQVYDMGAGTLTVQQLIVAEELGLDPKYVKAVAVDTDNFVPDSGMGASRTTNVAGHAAMLAVRQLKDLLLESASALLEAPAEDIVLEEGVLHVVGSLDRRVTLAEIAKRQADIGESMEASARYEATAEEYTSFCTQAAEVKVDRETGQIEILKTVSVVDAGVIINPVGFWGQVEGGMINGLGFGVMSELVMDEGQVTTLHLGDYKLPNIMDIPPHDVDYIVEPSGHTPYGGKGVGETTTPAVPGLIANAVADAVGFRCFSLPVSAEKILRGLQG